MAAAVPGCESSLQNIIDQTSLKWIFVGGKGGVGKTTVSCSLAIQLSRVRERVLLISTDPAHSLSDAFGQKFETEELVDGFTNLYATELKFDEFNFEEKMPENPTDEDHIWKMFVKACPKPEDFPGNDELLAMRILWRFVEGKEGEYSVVVVDTAPTGHAIRLIAFPLLFHKLFDILGQTPYMRIARLFCAAMCKVSGAETVAFDDALERPIRDVVAQLRNPALTTFVGVCTAEFLPLYETERMIQQLTAYGIDTHNLVVNQLLYSSSSCRPDDQSGPRCCHRCQMRRTMQEKYLAEIDALYQDVHVTKLPLMEDEVRGVDMLEPFSHLLLHPYTP